MSVIVVPLESILTDADHPVDLSALPEQEAVERIKDLFVDMDPVTIRQIASEIALVGMNGLDYASSEQKYTLRFLPGEQFSGLQLMCLMYVGFKKVDPAVDTGIRLDRAYQEALEMYEMGM